MGDVRASMVTFSVFKVNIPFCFSQDWVVFLGMTDVLSLTEYNLVGEITSYQDAMENIHLIG